MNKTAKQDFFTGNLMRWNNAHNKRVMPWKGEKDPYKIWLSEIILQQTRVEQGLEYYNRFVKKFPDINKLAAAPETEVFKLWEGLGYYSRCKNLIATAKKIAYEQHGQFPRSYEKILELKGVGPYTAAAIASFAFDHPHAVTDGNVYRVLARFFGIADPIDSREGKNKFALLSQSLLDKAFPAKYNQAIMDFGALICKPKLPLCPECPLKNECTALRTNKVNELPVKEKKLLKKYRFFFYIIAEYEGKTYIGKRQEGDIWQNLWEYILIEVPKKMKPERFLMLPEFIAIAGKQNQTIKISSVFTQQLTHQTIEAVFIRLTLLQPLKNARYTPAGAADIKKLPFPRLINTFREGE